MFDVRLNPHHGRIQRIYIDPHPRHGKEAAVGYCGQTYEDGWSLVTQHFLEDTQIECLDQMLRRTLGGADAATDSGVQ